MNFNQLSVKFWGGETHPAGLYADKPELVEIANSYETSELLEQSGYTAVLSVSHIDIRH